MSQADPLPMRCSPSCERNQFAIGGVLRDWLGESGLLLEVGSGTGQHAAYLIDSLLRWRWQPTDKAPDSVSIDAWAAQANDRSRILPALALDVTDEAHWAKIAACDAVLSVNTAHIMPWGGVVDFFAGAARVCRPRGLLFLYGPFHDAGAPTSDGNARFDRELRQSDNGMGIRDVQRVQSLAAGSGWLQRAHYQMPANNQMLVWERDDERR